MKQPQHVKNPVTPKWATEIISRYPNFKIHSKLGHARAAISYHSQGNWTSKVFVLCQASPPTNEEIVAHVQSIMAADLYEWDGENNLWVHHPEDSVSLETLKVKSITDHSRWGRGIWYVEVAR